MDQAVDQAMGLVSEFCSQFRPYQVFEIEDYPILWNVRGRCRLWTQYKPTLGMRVVKQTTSRKGTGIWHRPKGWRYKKGVYMVTVSTEWIAPEMSAGVLVLDPVAGVYLLFANATSKGLVRPPLTKPAPGNRALDILAADVWDDWSNHVLMCGHRLWLMAHSLAPDAQQEMFATVASMRR